MSKKYEELDKVKKEEKRLQEEFDKIKNLQTD